MADSVPAKKTHSGAAQLLLDLLMLLWFWHD